MTHTFRNTTWGWWIFALVVLVWFVKEDSVRQPVEWLWTSPLYMSVAIVGFSVPLLAPMALTGVKNTIHSEPQPAHKIFAMDRGWRVIRFVWKDCQTRTTALAGWWKTKRIEFDNNADDADNLVAKFVMHCVAQGYRLGGAIQFLPMFILLLPLVFMYTLVMGSMFIGSLGSILVLGGANRVSKRRKRSRVSCPNCHHENIVLPMFLCPNLSCRARHTRLWPSVYGVFRHDCTCGQEKLPTLERFGRSKLERHCPNCEQPLSKEVGMLTDIHFPVVGGVSAGKSSLMVMAIRELMSNAHAVYGATASMNDESQSRLFRQQLEYLKTGTRLERTSQTLPQAFNVTVNSKHRRGGKLVYIYDAAGEAWENRALASQQGYFERADGVLMVIDPLAMPRLPINAGENLSQTRTASGASTSDIEAVYTRVEGQLRHAAGVQSGGTKHTIPLAIAVTKVDEMGLEDVLGLPAVARLRSTQPEILSDNDAIHELVKQYLINYGLQPMIDHIDNQFSNVRYFSVSALGRRPDASNTPFAPIRAANPLFWLLEQSSVVRKPKK